MEETDRRSMTPLFLLYLNLGEGKIPFLPPLTTTPQNKVHSSNILKVILNI